ncbi:unnamed protein product [Ilex paraguariensis]|uniref:Uncharacterized protein n=1 Tax=Ilex paraguariensis TaxID=185542 RepID=A0ABC8TYG4_9AQUA
MNSNTNVSNNKEQDRKETSTSNISSLDSRFNQTLRNVQGFECTYRKELTTFASLLVFDLRYVTSEKKVGFVMHWTAKQNNKTSKSESGHNQEAQSKQTAKQNNKTSKSESGHNQEAQSKQLLKGRSFPGKVLITRRSNPLDDLTLRSPDTNRSFSDSDTGRNEQIDEYVEDEDQGRSKLKINSSVNKLKLSTPENTTKEIQKSTMGARATDSARLMKFSKELSGPAAILGIVTFIM